MSWTPVLEVYKSTQFTCFTTCFNSTKVQILTQKTLGLGVLVDIEIDLSTRNGDVRVFINSRSLKVTISNPVLINKTVITTDRLSTLLIDSRLVN